MQEPLVSIVITSFNRLEDLKETVKRVGDISYQNLEIIVVDGGSTDGSVDYLQTLDKKKYKVIILGVDKGSAFSHNVGMKAAEGDFVITLDDDCFIRPSVVQKIVEIFQAHLNLAVIGFGLINPKTAFIGDEYWNEIDFTVKNNQFDDCYQTTNYTSASAFRKSALEEVGYIDSSWDWSSRTEDDELNFKLIAHGYNSVMVPELVAYHKITPSNRNSDLLTINGIHGVIWIILKFYPPGILQLKLFKIFYFCFYFSILNKKMIYLKAVFRSLKKAHKMLTYKKRLTYSLSQKVHLPEFLIFGLNSDMKWAGS